MELHQAIAWSTEWHLTLADLNVIKGKLIDVVIWDRNFEEYGIWSSLTENKIYLPEEMFSNNKHQLLYNGGLTYDIIYNFGETVTQYIEVDVEEFSDKWKWYPLDDFGNIEVTSEPINVNLIAQTTRIGWRGPMMLWDNVKYLPGIYYKLPG